MGGSPPPSWQKVELLLTKSISERTTLFSMLEVETDEYQQYILEPVVYSAPGIKNTRHTTQDTNT
jgi:hypothetical protein